MRCKTNNLPALAAGGVLVQAEVGVDAGAYARQLMRNAADVADVMTSTSSPLENGGGADAVVAAAVAAAYEIKLSSQVLDCAAT